MFMKLRIVPSIYIKKPFILSQVSVHRNPRGYSSTVQQASFQAKPKYIDTTLHEDRTGTGGRGSPYIQFRHTTAHGLQVASRSTS